MAKKLHNTTQRRPLPRAVHTAGSHSFALVRVNRLVIDEPMAAGVVDRPAWGDFFFAVFPGPVTVEERCGRRYCEHGGLICWSRDSRHYYGNLSEPWLHSCMHFEGPAAEDILDDFPCDTVVPLNDAVLVHTYFGAIHSEIAQHAVPDEAIVRGLVEGLLRSVKRWSPGEQEAPVVPPEYLWLREHIRQHYDEKLRIGDLAALLHISPSKLFGDYRRYFGTSPVNERIRAQMEQARYFMANRTLSISQVALRVGVDSLPYFSRLVRSHFGKSPRALRGELLKGM